MTDLSNNYKLNKHQIKRKREKKNKNKKIHSVKLSISNYHFIIDNIEKIIIQTRIVSCKEEMQNKNHHHH